MATTISMAAAIAKCNAVVDLLDAGSGAGKLRIYDGSKPLNASTAITSQILLAELPLSDPAFGNAADATTKATATANAITSDTSANATGIASWYRAVDSDGNAVIDGSVGTSGADLNLNSTSIVEFGNVAVTSWTYSVNLA